MALRHRPAVILLEVVFLALFWSWVLCAILLIRNTILPRFPLVATPEQLGLPSETVSFVSTDGVRLEGWKIVSDPAQPWVILCHGLGSNRSDLLDIARGLHRAGLNLLLFDFRAHGGSNGRVTSFGWLEQRDLIGAMAYLGQQADISARPYGIYGISMGGAVALMVAGQDDRLAAVAVDSPYTNLEESIIRHVRLMYPVLPRVPFMWFVVATYRLRFGAWPKAMSSEEAAGHLGGRPLLIFQGGDDPRMTIKDAERIAARASGKVEVVVIQGASHLEGYSKDPAGYLKRLVGFLRKSLGEP